MKPEEIEKVALYLASLAGENFFGRVTLTFQNGRINTVKTEILRRLDELEVPASAGRLAFHYKARVPRECRPGSSSKLRPFIHVRGVNAYWKLPW